MYALNVHINKPQLYVCFPHMIQVSFFIAFNMKSFTLLGDYVLSEVTEVKTPLTTLSRV